MSALIQPGSFTSAPGGSNLLLDDYPSALAGLSFRKLRTAYSGDCMQFRDSDDDEDSFGFSGGVLDSASVLSWAAGANLYAVTWWDQGENDNWASKTTTALQPLYLPSPNRLVFTRSVGSVLDFNTSLSISGDVTYNAIINAASGSNTRSIIGGAAGCIQWRIEADDSVGLVQQQQVHISDTTTDVADGTDKHLSMTTDYDGSSHWTAHKFYIDGALDDTDATVATFTPSNTYAVGNWRGGSGGGEGFDGIIKEITIWPSVFSDSDISNMDGAYY